MAEQTEFLVKVVSIPGVEKHPQADRLEIINIDGYVCVSQSGTWKPGDLAVYVPVDALVPTDRPEFSFLKKEDRTHHRVKAMRLRGIFSMGLLVPAPPGSGPGDDVQEALGIQKYVPASETRLNAHNNNVAAARLAKKAGGLKLPVYGLDAARKYLSYLEWGQEVVITEKIHGCVRPGTSITMSDGSRRRMKDVLVGDYVLGRDSNGAAVASKVIQKFDNGEGSKWLDVRVTNIKAGKGISYRTLCCTPEHQIYRLESDSFVEAGDLRVGDTVYVNRLDLALNPIQREVLIGKMLGDGSADTTHGSVVWSHSIGFKDYATWTANCLGPLAHPAERMLTSGFGTSMVARRTVRSELVKEVVDSFFIGPNKSVPINLKLSPISLAFWYMDDGSLSHHEGQIDRAGFATCGFTYADCLILVAALKRLGIEAAYFESSNGGGAHPRLRLNSESAERLFMLIAPYIPACMQYKLPERYRGAKPWFPAIEYKPALIPQTIVRIKNRSEVAKRVDMETETHNYFAGGILVHNCNARFCYSRGRLWVGSHKVMRGCSRHRVSEYLNRLWLKLKSALGIGHRAHMLQESGDVWWQTAEALGLKERLAKFPDHILYGEIYGEGVQDLTYDSPRGRKFRAFDVFDIKSNRFLDWDEFLDFISDIGLDDVVNVVPVLYEGPWTTEVREQSKKLADTSVSTLAPEGGKPHLIEGVVIKPRKEILHPHIGRLALKYPGENYLLRKE